MYHRVVPPDKLIQAGMYVSPGTFEKHLQFLPKYFSVVPLNSLTLKQGTDADTKDERPLCVLTFDDGWKDFYDHAFPLLKKYRQHATVFLPTEFVGSQKKFWTDSFAYLLLHHQQSANTEMLDSEIVGIVEHLDSLCGPYDNQLEEGIEYLKAYPLDTIEEVLHGLADVWHVDINGAGRKFLSWEEIAEMKDSGLISFGSHTVNHQILTTLDAAGIKKELDESLNRLLEKKVVDGSCVSFCYPNGNHSKEIADMVRSSGYQLAVTTQNGWNSADADKFTLKRIGIHEDMTSTKALFACRVAGFM